MLFISPLKKASIQQIHKTTDPELQSMIDFSDEQWRHAERLENPLSTFHSIRYSDIYVVFYSLPASVLHIDFKLTTASADHVIWSETPE